MSRNAQAQRKLQPAYERDFSAEPQSQDDANRPTVRSDEPAIGRVEQLLRQHPALVHEIE